MNYNQTICYVEAPHIADTLILFEEGRFESGFYGKGSYEIGIGIGFETRIDLKYNEFGKGAINSTYFENKIFHKPKIILNADTNHYYEK